MKKLKRGMAFVLTLCMIFSIFTNVSVAQAATKKNVAKTVTVKTQKELEKALKDGKATKIKIVTSKKISLVIPKGKKTAGIQLVVNAPKATIVNKATFKKISITGSGAKSYTESGKNNVLVVSADSAKVTVAKNASVKTLTMDGAKATVVVNSGSKVAKVVVAEDQCNVSLKVNGTVSAVKVTGDASKISISGKASDTPVTVTGDQASVAASTSVKLDIQSDAKITLKDGAEGSSVKASDDVVIKVDNKTEEKVTVTTPSGKTEVGAGETVKDVVAQEKPEEDKKPEETKKPEGGNAGGSGSVSSGDSGNTGNNSGDNSSEEEKELSYDGYDLKWEDDFEGDSLNTENWTVEAHEPGWVNAEWQEYVDADHASENIVVSNGALSIIPKKIAVQEGNMFTNADFSNGKTGWSETNPDWTNNSGVTATSSVGDGKITYTITHPGKEGWHVQLKQELSLKQEKKYKVTFDVKSNVARTIQAGVQMPEEPYTSFSTGVGTSAGSDNTFSLTKGEKKTITINVNDKDQITKDRTGAFYISMGKIDDNTPTESVIEISDLMFTELDASGNPVATTKYEYTSGRINTQNKKTFTYGLFECRAKVPAGKGYLPAFWLMANDENVYGQWPRCGEIDCMEVMGQEPNKLYGTIHYGNPHGESQGTKTLKSGSFADDYHLFQCEWLPGRINWYVDGVLYHTENDWHSTTEGKGTLSYPAPFDQPFYIILNLAIGGSWVGNPDASTSFENQAYSIDYVKVYQKDSYDENVTKPEKTENWREPVNGNYVLNGNFATYPFAESNDWEFKTANGGAATCSVNNNELTVTTTNDGTVDYSVQLLQAGVPLKKTAQYKVSFQAKASEARTTGVAVKGGEDRGWEAYFSKGDVALTTDYQTYEYTFTMDKASNANARFEFNMGAAGSTATIHIKDIKLEMVKQPEADADSKKTVLADGNYIYNGEFQEGTGHLGYWKISEGLTASVTNFADGRRLNAVVNQAGASISQDALALVGGAYELSFDAEGAGTITVNVAGKTQTITTTAEKKNYAVKIKLPAEMTNKDFKLTFDTIGTYKIDNIRFVEDSLIKNGSFNAGDTGFEVFIDGSASATHAVDSLKEDNAVDFTIYNTSDAEWKIQLKQSNVVVEEGQCYRLSFDIKSSIARSIQYAIQRDGSVHKTDAGAEDWTPYVQETINLTAYGADGAYTHVDKCFKMTEGTDEGSIFNIALGGKDIKDQHRVCIDNIVLEKINESEMPKEPEGTQTEYAPGVAKVEGNLLAGKTWSPNNDDGIDFTTDETSCTCALKCYGANQYWPALEMKGINLENGKRYQLSMTINSTKNRKVNVVLQTGAPDYTNYGVEAVAELTANTGYEFSQTFTVDKATVTDGAIGLAIQLGKFGEDTCSNESVTFSNVTLKEVTE